MHFRVLPEALQEPKKPIERKTLSKPSPYLNSVVDKGIRRMVRDVKHKDLLPTIPLPGLSNVFNKEKSVLVQISWVLIILSSITACCYQGIERIQYYLTYPVAVDVHVEQIEHLNFPAISLCSQDLEIVASKFLTEEILRKYTPTPMPCMYRSEILLHHELKCNVTPMWSSYLRHPPQWIMPDIEGMKNVAFIHESFIMETGFCRTIKINTTLDFRGVMRPLRLKIKIPSHCTTYPWLWIAVHDLAEEPYRKDFFTDGIASRQFALELTKYVFLKRPGHDCTDAKTFSKCMKTCFASTLEAALPCRHTFLSTPTNLPFCNETVRITDVYQRDSLAIASLDPAINCSCSRKCIQNNFFVTINDMDQTNLANSRENVFSFLYQTNYVTSFIDRFPYPLISLLCDIGGNMGLYMGLSVLSTCEIFQISLNRYRQSMKSRFIIKEVLYKKIEKEYKKMKKSVKQSDSVLFRAFWSMILMCNFVGSVCFIWNRTSFYMKMPVTTVINVVGNGSVRLPGLTICYETESIYYGKISYARSRRMKSRCPVHILDLLELNVNATELWKASDLGFLKSADSIMTPFGICSMFDFGMQTLLGHAAGWTIIAQRRDNCYEVQKLFINAPGESFDFKSYRLIAANGNAVRVAFTIKEYDIRLTAPNCVSTIEASQCKELCLTRRLLRSGFKCRLPYMPESNLLYCNTSSSAKETMELYFRMSTETVPTQHCGCKRQCVKTIYDSRVRVYATKFGMQSSFTKIRIGFDNSYTNVISEIPVYPFVKLLCDIGGILGFVLGLSILNVLEVIGLSGGFLILKLAPKPKAKPRLRHTLATNSSSSSNTVQPATQNINQYQ